MLEDSGFTDVAISEPFDTFAGAGGEDRARAFAVYGYTFTARRR
jgi:glutamate mutase epsilon subunit